MTATDSPEERKRRAFDRIDGSDIPQADKDAIRSAAKAADKSPTTLESYIGKLVILAEETGETPFCELSASEMKDHIETLGESRDWSTSTYKIYESAALMLAEYLGKKKADIPVTKTEDNRAIDARTVLTQEEFHDIRESADYMRDKSLIDFLGFTGQRVRVAQALRIKDIDLDKGETGVGDMPPAEGLKNADQVGNERPLLGCLKTMGQWLEHHPTGEPDDPLFTPRRVQGKSKPGEQLSMKSMRQAIYTAAENAGVTDKPTNPHAFRHFFVTVAKKRYDIDDSTIKHMLGHSEESNVMSTTYRHLDDDHHVTQAEESMGLAGDDDTEVPAPPVCHACQRPLRPSVTTCPSPGCGERFDSDTEEYDTPTPTTDETVYDKAVKELMDMQDMDRIDAEEAMSKFMAEKAADMFDG